MPVQNLIMVIFFLFSASVIADSYAQDPRTSTVTVSNIRVKEQNNSNIRASTNSALYVILPTELKIREYSQRKWKSCKGEEQTKKEKTRR
jgi:hypothetical protein